MVLFHIFETIATNCVSKKRKFYIYLVFINHDKQILQCIEKKLKFRFHPLKQHFLTHHLPKAKNVFHPLFSCFSEIFLHFLPQNIILKIFRNFSKILIFLTLSPAEAKKSHASPAEGGKFFLPHPPAQEKS